MDFLKELNTAQRVASTHINGPMMVIAGAGSGKTRVLTYRIAHLIKNGVDPFNIMALTFTNKAAREMKSRIGQIVGEDEGRNIWMGTFHSIFARILRIEADRINYPSNFTIYDTQDTKSLLKAIIKELNLDDKVYKVGMVYGRISGAKNNLISAVNYSDHPEIQEEDRRAGRPELKRIYKRYVQRCYRAGAMDFDDLLFNTNVLLRDFPDVLIKYQHKFKYILVDEYQDTNFSQYLIIKQLAAAHENLCVVGDDAQSIYSFRGANIQNILNFKKDYPDFALYKLEQNYRSTKVIVEAANSVIEKNKDQIEKEVWTSNAEGAKIKVHRSISDNDEGVFVANEIFTEKNNNQLSNDSFAILYRTNAQSRSFEEALRKLNLNYRIYGGLSFYQRKEIKDLLAYFRLSANQNDEEALKRVINYPARGIGKTTLEKLIIAANENDTSLWNVLSSPKEYGVKVNSGTLSKLESFRTKIQSYSVQLEKLDAFELAKDIAKSTGILKELGGDKTPEGISRYENIQELLNGIKEFTDGTEEETVRTLSDFLVDVALLTDADEKDDGEPKISLMTIHAAKGLEFPIVFVVGLEENLFPSQLSLNAREDLEEERRLFYVAITRAEQKVFLSYAQTRFKWGNLISCEPSRFIDEIDSRFVDFPDLSQAAVKKPFSFDQERMRFASVSGSKEALQRKNFKPIRKLKTSTTVSDFKADDPSDIQTGMEVVHEKFGKGKVIAVEGNDPNRKATVFFPRVGHKQLLLRFAKIKILN